MNAGRSNFDIALRMFLKRRRAVAAGILLLLAFYAAIWAPLLATAAPLRFRGYDKGAATQAARLARLELQDLALALEGKEAWPRDKVEASFATVEFQLGRMENSLREEAAAKVRAVRGKAAALRAAPTAAGATALAAEVGAGLRFGEGDLVPRTRWPAFRALDALDVLLLSASLAFPFALLALRRRGGAPRRPGLAAAVVAVPAIAAAVLWALLSPGGTDRTDYKKGLREGTVVAESMLAAPIPFDINENDLQRRFEKPLSGDGGHWLGTDENGRDILCRMLWGARVSLSVGFVAVGIYVLLGIVVGAVAGYFRGWIDMALSRFIEWVICFPVFFLILVIVAFLQDRTILGLDPPQLVVIMVVIGITGWTGVARLVRAEFLRLVEQDFVRAARALGAPPRRIIFGHVLPNAMAPVLVAATFGVAGAILTESGLSFLGLGITVPKPSWGGMLFAAHGYEQVSTWIFLWPGLAIFLVITCYNLVGEALRDALDPRLRQ